MDLDYYVLLEQLTQAMTNLERFDIQEIYRVMEALCKHLRVAKGETCFYEDVEHEKRGQGDVFVCYDSGEVSQPLLQKRVVFPPMMVATCTVYLAEGQAPWTEIETQRIELIQRMMLSFLNRTRLQSLTERLLFYDDDGFANLRFFFSRVGRMAEAHALNQKAAVRFNLKHFAMINRQIGRMAGSMAMHGFIERIKETIGEQGFVCRIGGDNFILMCGKDRLSEVLRIMEGTPIVYDTETKDRTMVTASAGVFAIPEDYVFRDPGDIMDKVTSASQAAKNGDHGDVIFVNEQMESAKERMMLIDTVFPQALMNEEFLVYYQPKIDVNQKVMVGAEALCRWMHEGKLIPPNDFIPELERTMDICKLDFYMLEHVCMDIRRWLDEGKPVVRVSINLSRKHMINVDLYKRIIEIIDKHHVPHKYIEIELTETTTDVEFLDLKRVVSGLQNAGISTSVDDFGIGYSSLNLIREIPWNVLKVDKNFLPSKDADDNNKLNIMFKHVVSMANELGLECVAEGVETAEQVQILQENDCPIAQGFYYDKPLPKTDFERHLDSVSYA